MIDFDSLEKKLNKIDEIIATLKNNKTADWIKRLSPFFAYGNDILIVKFMLIEVADTLNTKLIRSLLFKLTVSDLEADACQLRDVLGKIKGDLPPGKWTQ